MAKQCINCGTTLPDNAVFCSTCDAPQDTVSPYASVKLRVEFPKLGMKWHKFLIYLGLWGLAGLYLFIGISSLNSARAFGQHQGYSYYPEPFREYMILWARFQGISALVYAAWIIITRFKLAHYRASGPKHLIIMVAFSQVVNIVHSIAMFILKQNLLSTGYTFPPNIYIGDLNKYIEISVGNVIYAVVWGLLNYRYFRKREHLFHN